MVEKCPVCGGDARVRVKYGAGQAVRQVFCAGCQRKTGWYPTETEALEAWNAGAPWPEELWLAQQGLFQPLIVDPNNFIETEEGERSYYCRRIYSGTTLETSQLYFHHSRLHLLHSYKKVADVIVQPERVDVFQPIEVHRYAVISWGNTTHVRI